jgi:hypothetical protein
MRGFAMSSFEWMELQTLTSDIAASRSRLAAARAAKDNRLARVLEQEITAAERRRDELLVNITDQVAGGDEPAPQSGAADSDPPVAPEPAVAVMTDSDPPDPTGAEPPPDAADRAIADGSASRSTAAPVERREGDNAVWEQLTPGDIQNAKDDLAARRVEMLARHAEELTALDADQSQLDTLAEAIELFARKFKSSPQPEGANAAVVTLEEERELRLQGRA